MPALNHRYPAVEERSTAYSGRLMCQPHIHQGKIDPHDSASSTLKMLQYYYDEDLD